MTKLSSALLVRGEIWSDEDLVIEGRIEGWICADKMQVTVASGGSVDGELIARDIIVYGSVVGSLVATEVVDLRESACVGGRVVSERVILVDGTTFNGTVEPQQLHAALNVARHRHASLG